MTTVTTPTRDDVFRWADDLYANAVDRKDAAGFAAAFTPDGWCRFGNQEPLVGRETIREAIAGFFTAMVSLRHTPQARFFVDDTLVLEALVTYLRHDGGEVTVPAVTIFHVAGVGEDGRPLADSCRIYVDLAPLFAPGA